MGKNLDKIVKIVLYQYFNVILAGFNVFVTLMTSKNIQETSYNTVKYTNGMLDGQMTRYFCGKYGESDTDNTREEIEKSDLKLLKMARKARENQ